MPIQRRKRVDFPVGSASCQSLVRIAGQAASLLLKGQSHLADGPLWLERAVFLHGGSKVDYCRHASMLSLSIMTYLIYLAAALAEITGCYAFWAWLRLDRSALWLFPGVIALCLFAWLLTLVETEQAGRAYAAYGGIYILCALGWLWAAEGVKPDRWDIIGAAVCIIGASIILWGPRPA